MSKSISITKRNRDFITMVPLLLSSVKSLTTSSTEDVSNEPVSSS